MKFGLLTYEENKNTYNVGDYIQSLAAAQYLPRVDAYVNREKLADYRGEKMKMILNGWFTHNTKNWIPSEDIEPLFISFHINNTASKNMLSPEGVAYLKKHEPIGCRDKFTVTLLQEKGIEAYFSGCLTLTLDSYKKDPQVKREGFYVVDPLYGYPTSDKIFSSYKKILRGIASGEIFALNKRKNTFQNYCWKSFLPRLNFLHKCCLPIHKPMKKSFYWQKNC